MLSELWNTITEYFRAKPYWPAIQGLFTLLSLPHGQRSRLRIPALAVWVGAAAGAFPA
jgi:hypothetical protein